MNYTESHSYVESLGRLGSVLGLSNIMELLKRLGNPQNKIKCIHIAGTNGKGSVLAFLANILKTAGYNTGAYISPAVKEYLEIIQLNGQNISETEFAEVITDVKAVCDHMIKEGLPQPTQYEVLTACAFLYFYNKNCDIALIETGLGGTEDATNVIDHPVCCIITSISMDHMAVLGNSLELIAKAKAGIIMKECPVVSIIQDPVVNKVLTDRCIEQNSVLYLADRSNATNISFDIDKGCISYNYKDYNELNISLLGSYQVDNSLIVLECIHVLNSNGIKIDEHAVRQGLYTTKWFGRFSVISKSPLFIMDGAHNQAGAKMLADSIRIYLKDRKITLITGIFADKDYSAILKETMRYADHVITVETPDNIRALPAGELTKFIETNYKVQVSTSTGLDQALRTAYETTDQDGVILAFGSLSFLGRLYKEYLKLK